MTAIDQALAIEEAQRDSEIGISNWIIVDQPMIDKFAETTFDDQWIHIDPQRAKAETPFGGAIAHGFLTLSLASRFAYDVLSPHQGQVMGINYGFDKIRFLSPVVAGSRVRGRFTLNDVGKRSATELLRTHNLTIEIEGSEQPALAAKWLSLIIFQ